MRAFLKELFGLFVDDGNLAIALVIWVGLCGLGLPRMLLPNGWNAPILFAGCAIILVFNVMRRARAKGE